MKSVSIVVMALVAGVTGGIIGSRVRGLPAQSPPTRVIQASRFDLVDNAGNTISSWGTDQSNDVLLTFRYPKGDAVPKGGHTLSGNPRGIMSLGVLANGLPWLGLMGPDGEARVRLYVGRYEKPILLMEDGQATRVSLGFEAPDTDDPQADDWSLTFFSRNGVDDMASIGTLVKQKHIKGYVELNGEPFVTSLFSGRSKRSH
jgi:hypothetical protein